MSAPFPVEKAPTERVPVSKGQPSNGVKISRLLNYPVRGLVYEGGNTLKDLSDTVAGACIWLQENNIPFNVLISDSGKKIFLFPQVISIPHFNLTAKLFIVFPCCNESRAKNNARKDFDFCTCPGKFSLKLTVQK